MNSTQPKGFLSLPAQEMGNGILVLHPWWGLNDTIKTFCTRLSEAGFIAFAPDLYHGKIVTTIPEAKNLVKSMDGKMATKETAEAADFLSQRASQTSREIAVIGFSLGASFALDLSITHPSIVQSVVVFYGTSSGDYSASRAEYLGHFAENDEYESESDVKALESSLKAAGRPFTFHLYPGTGHWFFEPDRKDAYNRPAAGLAWERTLAFLATQWRQNVPVEQKSFHV